MTLPNLPKTIANGVLWVVCAGAFASWAGWLETPQSSGARQRAAIEDAARQASGAQQSIYLLQYQQQMMQSDIAHLKSKLDEMAMVLYSLERRSR